MVVPRNEAGRGVKSVCVYCGSSPGRQEVYAEAVRALGRSLAARRIRLVYGGSSVGLMGVVADTVLGLGGEVVGVIPQALFDKEVGHPGLSELHVTASMHERKAKMAELSDGFVALPGGVGTLEEIFEIWTWAQLGLHGKPCGLLDVGGFYSALVEHVDRATAEGFIRPEHRRMLLVEEDPDALLDRFAAHVAPAVPKWIGEEET